MRRFFVVISKLATTKTPLSLYVLITQIIGSLYHTIVIRIIHQATQYSHLKVKINDGEYSIMWIILTIYSNIRYNKIRKIKQKAPFSILYNLYG